MPRLNDQLSNYLYKPSKAIVREMLNEPVRKISDQYAFTFNIAGGVRVNRKIWKNYHPSMQISLLVKILHSNADKHSVQIDWSRIVIERCPLVDSMHLHGIIITDDVQAIHDLCSTINANYNPQTDDYETFQFEKIFDIDGWENYISKNQR